MNKTIFFRFWQSGWIVGVPLVLLVAVVLFFFLYQNFSNNQSTIKVTSVSGLAPFDHWKMNNGAIVYFSFNDQFPMLDIKIQFHSGYTRDGDKSGLSKMETKLLNEGAGILSAEDLALEFASVGAQYHAFTTSDAIGIQVRTLNDASVLKKVTDLLSTILSKPTFPTTSIERVRNEMLLQLEVYNQTPSRIAQRTFLETAYQNHPYGLMLEGTKVGINKIQQADLMDYHKKYIVTNNMVITLVGNITKEKAQAMTEQLTKNIESGKKLKPVVPVPMRTEKTIVRINYPSNQAHVFLVQPAISYFDPDYFSLMVGDFILGHFDTSRIFQEIRKEKGFAYSAYSILIPTKEKGPFISVLQTRKKQSQQAASLLERTIAKFLKEGPTEDELILAKKYLLGALFLKINSNEKIMNEISNMAFFGLPDNFLTTYSDKIQESTKKDIQLALSRHWGVKKMVLVVVGGENEQDAL